MVETCGYDSPRTNKGPLMRIVAFFCQDCLGIVNLRRKTMKRVFIDGASMTSVDQNIANSLKGHLFIFSELIDVCEEWKRR